jgi:hypothetical protein
MTTPHRRQPWELAEPHADQAPATSEPIREHERGRLARPDGRRRTTRPTVSTTMMAAAGTAIVVLGLFCGAVAGWSYLWPFAVVLVVLIAFAAIQRGAGIDQRNAPEQGPQYAARDARGHRKMRGPAGGAGGPR